MFILIVIGRSLLFSYKCVEDKGLSFKYDRHIDRHQFRTITSTVIILRYIYNNTWHSKLWNWKIYDNCLSGCESSTSYLQNRFLNLLTTHDFMNPYIQMRDYLQSHSSFSMIKFSFLKILHFFYHTWYHCIHFFLHCICFITYMI